MSSSSSFVVVHGSQNDVNVVAAVKGSVVGFYDAHVFILPFSPKTRSIAAEPPTDYVSNRVFARTARRFRPVHGRTKYHNHPVRGEIPPCASR